MLCGTPTPRSGSSIGLYPAPDIHAGYAAVPGFSVPDNSTGLLCGRLAHGIRLLSNGTRCTANGLPAIRLLYKAEQAMQVSFRIFSKRGLSEHPNKTPFG